MNKKIIFLISCIMLCLVPFVNAEVTDGLIYYWDLHNITGGQNMQCLTSDCSITFPIGTTTNVTGVYKEGRNDSTGNNRLKSSGTIDMSGLDNWSMCIELIPYKDTANDYVWYMGDGSGDAYYWLGAWKDNGGVYFNSKAIGSNLFFSDSHNRTNWNGFCVTKEKVGSNYNYSVWRNGLFSGSAVSSANEGINDYITLGHGFATEYYVGARDEFGIWNRNLNSIEMIELHNNYLSNLGYPFVIPFTSDLEIKLYNNSKNEKIIFGQGENFYTVWNWTKTNLEEINSSVGQCNATFNKVLIEYDGTNDNFTVCNSGCDYTTYNDYFNEIESNNVVNDIIYFDACKLSPSSNTDLNLNISCGINNNNYIIPYTQYPLCPLTTKILINFTMCNNFDSVNISLNNGIQGVKIKNIRLDRRYINHTNVFNNEVFYNYTNKLWYINHKHENYIPDKYNISIDCKHNSLSELNINDVKEYEILNAVPIVNIYSIINDKDIFNVYSNNISIIEFDNSSFLVNSLINDFDLLNFTFTLYNNNKNIVYYIKNNSPTMPYSLFTEFINNTFNLSLSAYDKAGQNSFYSVLFNITDITAPRIVGATNKTIKNNTNISFTIKLYDSYLFNYNLSCSNDYNKYTENIGSSFYSNTSNFRVTENITCFVKSCDGHTGTLIEPLLITENLINGEVTIDKTLLSFSGSLKDINTVQEYDRVKFSIEYETPQEYIILTLSDEFIPAKNSIYLGHFISKQKNVWLDLEGDYKIKFLKTNQALITPTKPTTTFNFESIGVLNCINKTFIITPYVVVEPSTKITDYKLDSLENIGLIFILVILYIALLTLAFVFKNFGLMSFAFFIGVIIGFMLSSMGMFLTLVIMLMNIVLFIVFVKDN